MTGTSATRTSHDQQPRRSDMDDGQREEHLRTAYRAADQDRHAADEAVPRPSPEDPATAYQRARDAMLAALTRAAVLMALTRTAGLDGDEAVALAERAARQQQDHESDVPAGFTEHGASRYPAQVRSITWPLLADGYTVTWAPDPAGCTLTLDRHGPRGEHDAYRGAGPTMQRAWDEVRAQLGHGQPQPAGGTREAPGPARGGDRLYRVVQYYDSWPFHHDSRIPHGSRSRRRTDTFRTLGPVRDRLARANGYARYQRQEGGDWSAFVAIAQQLTDDGWQPIDVDPLQEQPAHTHRGLARAATAPSAPSPAFTGAFWQETERAARDHCG